MGEDQQKQAEVIDAQRFFNQIAREKLERNRGAKREIDKKVKTQSDSNPTSTEQPSFFDPYNVEINGQKSEDEDVKPYPEESGVRQSKLRLTGSIR